MYQSQSRPDFLTFQNGEKAPLPFAPDEYDARIAGLRRTMQDLDLEAVILTSMENVAYFAGFLYCGFGRPYACVVTADRQVTISANIDGGQPWRRCFGENLVYTDWRQDNFWRAVKFVFGSTKRIGVENDHLTLAALDALKDRLNADTLINISVETMRQRMVKSAAETALIRESARIADLAGAAIMDAIKPGAREIDVAMAGRAALEEAVADRFPDSELRDSWIWFQSGLNTDGAHNPVTTRRLEPGDILSLNVFPMISGYYTALERSLFLGEPDPSSRRIWEANVAAHELGLSLIRPGIRCSEICEQINDFLISRDLLQFRAFGYGHSFGLLSHYYGREAGLELREDIDTVLEPGMVVSMEPMLTIPQGLPGAGGYREHDILIVGNAGAENLTGFPYGPEHLVIAA